MTKIELEVHEDALSAINKIRGINDSGIELVIPEGSVLFDNIISLKLLMQVAEKSQKVLQFTTEDEKGSALIESLEEPSGQIPQSDFDSPYPKSESTEEKITTRKKFLSSGKIPKIKIPKIKINKTAVVSLIVLILAGAAIAIISTRPVAYIQIVVNSQPLTRSPAIKLVAAGATDLEKMILKGQKIEASVEVTGEIETTGEKLVGEKAKGNVIVYNKTDSEIKLEKGSKLNYDEKDLVFRTREEITIPPREEQVNPDDPTIQTYKLGEKKVEVEAGDIGSAYNLDDDTALEVDGKKQSEVTAITDGELSGGESEKVKVVAEADKTALQKKITEEAVTKATNDIKFKLGKAQKLIEGSVSASITKEAYSAQVGDEEDKLTLTAYAAAAGLTYLDTELNSFMDKKVEELIPEGYILSEKQRELTVTPLGTSSSSTLTAEEADLQVTLKTYIVTKINKEELIKALAGKSYSEAEKVLGGIRNINTYSLKIEPSIPFFKKVPKNINRIRVEIENE